MPNEGFAQALDTRWQTAMARAGLRDKTLTLTVLKRPPLGARLRLKRSDSIAQLKDQTAKQLRKLEEVVGFLLSSFAEMNPRLLGAESGELLGFLGALNIGQERTTLRKIPLWRHCRRCGQHPRHVSGARLYAGRWDGGQAVWHQFCDQDLPGQNQLHHVR